jgi:hypothetical protein
MAGILDNKKRIMDVAITEEGRRQMSSGKMKIEFVSFTDRHTYYEGDIASGSVNASDRIFLEATSLPQDSITFETDSSGNIVSFAGGDLELDPAGFIYEPSTATVLKKVVSPDIFSSLTASLLKQTLDSFKNQFLIGTYPFNDVSSSFGADHDYISFNVNDTGPAASSATMPVDSLNPSPFNDVMLFTRHTDYLPPIFTDTAGTKKIMTAPGSSWPDLTGGKSMDTLSDVVRHVFIGKPDLGTNLTPSVPDMEIHDLIQPNTTVKLIGSGTPDMNIACQMFEIAKNDTKITKLEMVDTGYWTSPAGYSIRAVFAGKVFIDSVNTPCFVPMFTLLFSNNKAANAAETFVDSIFGEGTFAMLGMGSTHILELILATLQHQGDTAESFNSGLPSDQSPDRSGLRED